MDFTREPIIETVITPKEGYKLVVRSSKSGGQEEFFVDAVEVVSFGSALFFRSQERPKSFLVPVSDYEVLEVREARMVLKHVAIDRAIKIGGGRDANVRPQRESSPKSAPVETEAEPKISEGEPSSEEDASSASRSGDRKRDRRRNSRRRRTREDGKEEGNEASPATDAENSDKDPSQATPEKTRRSREPEAGAPTGNYLSALLPPPTTLISETIARYKDNALFKDAFFTKEEKEAQIIEDAQLATNPEALENREAGSSDIEPTKDLIDITQLDDVHDDLWGFIPEKQDNPPSE